jgi:hypothetical protein
VISFQVRPCGPVRALLAARVELLFPLAEPVPKAIHLIGQAFFWVKMFCAILLGRASGRL